MNIFYGYITQIFQYSFNVFLYLNLKYKFIKIALTEPAVSPFLAHLLSSPQYFKTFITI